jgi:hypothetical protein
LSDGTHFKREADIGYVTREEFEKLYKQINGNGQPGIIQSLSKVGGDVGEIKAVQIERQRVDARRWVVMMVILAAMTLVVSILALLQGLHAFHEGELNWPIVPHKSLYSPESPVVASWQHPQQNVLIPVAAMR